jgi:hypothetical protein
MSYASTVCRSHCSSKAPHVLPDPIRTLEHPPLRQVGTDDEDHVLVNLLGAGEEIPHRPPGEDPAHDLHVLLRHRLLLQPHGFEGVWTSGIDIDANDLARTQV